MELDRGCLRDERDTRMRHEPAQHLSLLKILFAVLVCTFPRVFIDHIFIARHLQVVHLDRSIYVNIFLVRARLDIPHKERAHRTFSCLFTFFAELREKSVYIIFYINLRTVAHISDLPDIFR